MKVAPASRAMALASMVLPVPAACGLWLNCQDAARFEEVAGAFIASRFDTFLLTVSTPVTLMERGLLRPPHLEVRTAARRWAGAVGPMQNALGAAAAG